MRSLVPCVLVSALVALAPAPLAAQTATTSAGGDAAYYFLLARHLESRDKVNEAIAALQRALTLAPESAEVRAELAGLYARQNRPIDAVNMAEEALNWDPNNREANRILGLIFGVLADQKRALRPGDDPAQYQARAIAALEKVRGDVSDLNLLLTLGRLHLRAGAPEKAVVPLRRVFEEQPQFTEGAMLLSAAQEGSGAIADASATLETALEANPSSLRALARLTELYERQRRWKEAASAYARAEAINPKADLTSGRAAALMNSGAPEKARDLLLASIAKRKTPDAALLYLLAESQRQMKDLDSAASTAQQLRQAFPEDPRGFVVDAQLKLARGEKDQAIAAFADLVKRVPEEPNFVYQYAQLLEDSGRRAEAERALRDLIARDPRDANALNSLGYMFADRGERLDEAVDLLERALKLEPGNPSFLDSLGWAYFRQGKLANAEQPLAEAAAQMPGNAVVQDHLGDLRFKQARYEEAVAAWERALAGDGEVLHRAEIEKKLRDARARLPRK
jgi:tetratricopeptide (TPR) repeat protein